MPAETSHQLRFAIIGCGLIGHKRAAGLRANRLMYACDLDYSRAEKLAASYPGCRATIDYSAIMNDSAVDAVVVATLNAALAPLTLAAVNAGKHVLVEKPGALNAQQLQIVQRVASDRGVVVQVGYNHRFHPAIRKALSIVESREIGPLMFLRGRYGHGGRVGYDREWRADLAQSGGGELMDQGVHLIDIASSFLGDFTRYDGHASTHFWDMSVDDNAFLSLRTENGQTAWLHVSCTEWKNLFSLEVYGRYGKLSIDGLGGSYGVERLAYYKMSEAMGPPETTIWEFPQGDDSWSLEIAAFCKNVGSSPHRNSNLEAEIKTLQIVESIYRSSGYSINTASL